MVALTSLKPANMVLPTEGSKAMGFAFDHTVLATVVKDFQQEETNGVIDTIQSVFIDNANNAAPFILTVRGAVPPQRIYVQPFSQGYFPVTAPIGPLTVSANTTPGQTINTIFYNCPMPYFVWGATPGVLVVPPLTNLPISQALAIGDNIVIAPVVLQTIKMYRLMLNVDAPTTLTFNSGPGAGTPMFGNIFLLAFGSIYLQPTGVQWMTTGVNAGFNIRSTAVANIGGQLGYVQN